MTKKFTIPVTAAFIAVSLAGCAVEVPMSAFRMAPPDPAQDTDAQRHQSTDQRSVQPSR